jgi:hypothetical protein
MKNIARIAALSSMVVFLAGCPKQKDEGDMTSAEAKAALEESTVDSQAAALTTSSVEIGTNFTIGKAVKDAAAELRDFVGTQLPCAEITLVENKLTVVYGAKPGNCTWKGHTISGSHSMTVAKTDGEIEVDHEWKDLSNGVVKVSGSAHVTWSFEDKTRHVEHDLTWTRIKDGKTGRGTGDRTQRPLEGGVAEGIQVDGNRTWTGAAGRWDLAIEGVQMRWEDPCPQAGSYRLVSPKGRSLTLSFSRVDEDSIEVTLKNDSGNTTREFKFTVNSIGDVDDAS